MPLPKPPTKKAALLSAADFEAQAAPKPEKRTIKAHAESAPAPLALHDGGANVDDLRGGNGNDTIVGGSGGDTMYGNAGNDVFRFAVGSGSDAIVGWEDGLDRIDISTYAGATFANTVITQVGGDTRVTFVSGDSVLLIGVSAATVTIADFIT